ncbi:glycosyltransferase family 4 protein [Pseudonocardia sp. K10HN5]|uniref:Glycosyltransferase family 4 protein n=1 Tax=Pseudonocardia acidicola TaxID=2724939 RepID=A0ABX1SAY9_9PSEU|nr:glycosyltransferase family 1 protein [Pseudonocardia acidicola]NMH97414.1 glycosyltransferase family 4 protein [Pseudonocardia acidicola]
MVVEQAWHRVPGGVARSILETLRALRERTDVDVVPVAAWHRTPPDEPWTIPPPVRHLPLPRVALYEAWQRIRRPAVQRVTGPVDLVHATTMAVPPSGGAALVVTVHDLAFRSNPGHFTRRGLRFFERGLALVRAEADLVLCPSRATAHSCVAAGIPQQRVRIVAQGVRVPAVDADQVRRLREAHGLRRDYVMWCGTLEPRKNVPALLAAFRQLVEDGLDLDLVLVGPAGWGSVDTAVAGPAAERVRRLGFLSSADLHAAYGGARVFCYPSLTEGFGLPVLEAMAHAVPVVTSRGTAAEEAAGGAALLVEPTDVQGLASALAAAAGDRHDELAAAGAARAAQASWTATAAATVEAYREAVRRRQARGR